MSKGSRSGFTLLEALVSAVLMAVGIAAILRGIGSLARTQALLIERERIQALALEKYEELAGTGEYAGAAGGEFTDESERLYQWESSVDPTGTANLNELTVTVSYEYGGVSLEESITGFVYIAPAPAEEEEGPARPGGGRT